MKPVFKYRGADCSTIKRDLKSLSKNEIFAAAFSSLNDPFEAVIKIDEKSFEVGNLMSNWVPDENKGERLESCSSLKKAAYDFFHFAKNTGIYSLSKTATDELLWAHYASSHKGFCLEFDLDKLLDYKLEGEEVLDVAYTNTPPVISVADLLVSSTDKSKLLQNLTATKSIRWRYESEIRICVGKPGLREYDFRALKAVYFGVRCESKLIRLTMKLLRGRGVKYFKMSLKENSYELTAVEIEDEFLCPVEYRARLASVEVGVPHLDQKTKPFESELKVAIEITRRDPYCENVVDAYISSSKGSPENPVFYISFERSDGRPRKRYYSLSEIRRHEVSGLV